MVRRLLAAALTGIALTAAPARADTLIVPFWGVNFGGDSGKNLSDAFDAKRYNFGVSFSFMGAGVFGVEADFGYSPDFFGRTDVGGSNVLTGTGNLVFGIPFGGQKGFGIRPYALIGAGVMRASADFEQIDENSATWDYGGGIAMFFGTRVGIRFDFRYFRTFDDVEILGIKVVDDKPGKLDFTRSSLGLVFRF
jgi:opacity protein-like surface antigen